MLPPSLCIYLPYILPTTNIFLKISIKLESRIDRLQSVDTGCKRTSGRTEQASSLGLEVDPEVHCGGQLYCPYYHCLDLEIELESNVCHSHLFLAAPNLENEEGMIHSRCCFCFVLSLELGERQLDKHIVF